MWASQRTVVMPGAFCLQGPHTHRCTVTPARIEGTVGVRAYLGLTLSSRDENSCKGLPGGLLPTSPSALPLPQAPQQCKPVPFLELSRTAWYSAPALDCTWYHCPASVLPSRVCLIAVSQTHLGTERPLLPLCHGCTQMSPR